MSRTRYGLLPPGRPTGPARRERGSASIQLVILLPALFTLMFLGLQAALFYQARTVAIAAASMGAQEAAAEQGTLDAGLASASTFLATSTQSLTGATLTGSRTASTASVTVTGRSLSVIPFWTPAITQSASAPVERLTGAPGEFSHPDNAGGEN